jgi:ubiquinol-cytochrome c reductase iron-sulfur subunit
MKVWRWLVAAMTLALGRVWRKRDERAAGQPDDAGDGGASGAPAPGAPERRAENVVLVLLGLAVLSAIGFVVVYAEWSPVALPNELLGVCLALCLAFIGAALAVVGKRLVENEELEDDYPQEHPEQQQEVAAIVRSGGNRFTRKRLLLAAGVGAGGALGMAALVPALSLGPIWDTEPLDETPWRRGVRLVDSGGKPILAADIQHASFYTAFADGVDPEEIASDLVVLRLDPDKLQLPAGRADWAPEGILAYSKICTHAGCAIALYRNPKFPPLEPSPALVCPCHYSTFDPFTGGTVVYGPAGRPLPQLPLMIDTDGYLAAAGNFSGRIGPGWWNVREQPT